MKGSMKTHLRQTLTKTNRQTNEELKTLCSYGKNRQTKFLVKNIKDYIRVNMT